MPSNRKSGRPSQGNVPPTTRRSARQQRLASREASRAVSRAGTHGSSGGSRSIVLYTVGALIVGALILVAAVIFTQGQGGHANGPLTSPFAPKASVGTPSGLHTDGRTLGDPNAAVTIDLWADFQCTACYTFTETIEPQVVSDLVATGKAKMVFHDELVIDSKKAGSTESLDAANAALCANDQGKFWPYHDWLFANQYQENSGAFTKDRLKATAAAMGGLDLTKFNSCVDSGTHNGDVQGEQAKIPSGSSGTPTILVNNKLLSSFDYSTIANAVLGALGQSPTPTVSPTPKPSTTATPVPSVPPATLPSASPSVQAS